MLMYFGGMAFQGELGEESILGFGKSWIWLNFGKTSASVIIVFLTTSLKQWNNVACYLTSCACVAGVNQIW